MQAWYSRHYCGICVDVFKIEGIYIIVELVDVIIIFFKIRHYFEKCCIILVHLLVTRCTSAIKTALAEAKYKILPMFGSGGD